MIRTLSRTTLAALVLLVPATLPGSAPVAAQEGKAPAFAAAGVLNLPETKAPLALLEGRLVLVSFFAPWSDHCAKAVPHLNKLQDRWGGHGLSVLAISEGTLEQLKPFVEENGVTFGVAALDTLEYEKVANAFSVPGLPHGALVSPDGRVVWSGHPQSLKDDGLEPHLTGIRTPPPRLPGALAEQQKLFEDGRWAAARASLTEALPGLDKVSKRWAEGLVVFVDARRGSWLEDAAALETAGRHWDAWETYTDFARRFEGLAGNDVAAEKAAAIRANPEAQKDLEAGDDIVKAKQLLAEGKTRPAQLILSRVAKSAKGTVHADRAKALLSGL